MSDFLSGLVDRAAGRAPVLERRIAPRFEPPRDRMGLGQDPMVQPPLEEIFEETSELQSAPPRRRKVAVQRDNEKAAESRNPAPLLPVSKASPGRENRTESSINPPKAAEKVERVSADSSTVERSLDRISTTRRDEPVRPAKPLATPSIAADRAKLDYVRSARPNAALPAQERGTFSKVEGRPILQPVIRPAVTPRAPQVIVQRERKSAPTIQVTIGRIEVRTASGPAAPSPAPRSGGPKLNLEDYLKSRGGGSR